VTSSAVADAPDPVEYLDTTAATAEAAAYKRRLADLLDLHPGHVVLDVGCGPGTDLATLAGAVTATGTVIGVDHDTRMLDEARRRLADHSRVELRPGDAHGLPLPDATVDRARVDRVLQHLADPALALAEAHRVLRPGGLFGMAEPDWDTLVVADEDLTTGRAFARSVAARVRNATVGRDLVRLATATGFTVRSVEAIAFVLRDVELADTILGLRRNTARAVRDGILPEADARRWLTRLETGPFLAGFTFYLVVAEKNGRPPTDVDAGSRPAR
jgi:ubiquinone/menaquinone biosynthesis C-methylase UbiE